MKSLETLYQEIQANEEMKNAFASAFKEGKVEEFLKDNDCDGTAEDVMKFMGSKKEGAIADDDLEKVAGGTCSSFSCHCTDECTLWCV